MPAEGAAQLRAIAAACDAMGSRGLLNGTRATLRAQAKPIVAAAQDEARQRLPKRGGLAEKVASEKWRVSALAGARSAGVMLRTTGPATAQTDNGFVRHPIFGNRGKGQWVTQQLPEAKGWATDTVNSYGPALAAAMVVQLDLAAASIARAAGGA